MIHLLLIALLALPARAGYVYLFPERTCRWCRGERRRRCWRCRGSGHTWRLGARLARRACLAALRAWQERDER